MIFTSASEHVLSGRWHYSSKQRHAPKLLNILTAFNINMLAGCELPFTMSVLR